MNFKSYSDFLGFIENWMSWEYDDVYDFGGMMAIFVLVFRICLDSVWRGNWRRWPTFLSRTNLKCYYGWQTTRGLTLPRIIADSRDHTA